MSAINWMANHPAATEPYQRHDVLADADDVVEFLDREGASTQEAIYERFKSWTQKRARVARQHAQRAGRIVRIDIGHHEPPMYAIAGIRNV